jgi:hypothetical protein
MAMLDAQQQFTREEAVLDRQLETVRLEMQTVGMDYSLIENAIAAGRISPDEAVEFVRTQFPDLDITAADPNAIYQELDRDYRVQQYQFAQTNPDYAIYVDATGNEVPAGTPGATFKELNTEGAGLFNEFLNTSYYGPDGKPIVGGQEDLAARGADYSWASGLAKTEPDGLALALRNGAAKGADRSSSGSLLLACSSCGCISAFACG